MSYAGMVIGGPWAGKSYEGKSARVTLRVGRQYAEFPDRDEPPKLIEAHRFDYVLTELFGVRLWVPRGWSQDDIAREVFTNYRPAVMRELSVTEGHS